MHNSALLPRLRCTSPHLLQQRTALLCIGDVIFVRITERLCSLLFAYTARSAVGRYVCCAAMFASLLVCACADADLLQMRTHAPLALAWSAVRSAPLARVPAAPALKSCFGRRPPSASASEELLN
jgi:hypothetical protein